jgi:chromosome segregation ATPase
MAFSVSDYEKLMRLLEAHPELRAGLRRLLLGDDRDELRVVLQELADAQKRTEKALVVLTERVDRLAEAQQRTEQRLDRLAEAQQRTEEQLAVLTERVDRLTEAQQHTEEQLAVLTERVDRLTEAQQHTEEQLAALTERVDRLAEAQQRTEERLTALTERVDRLAEAQQRTEQALLSLTGQVRLLTNEVAQLKGSDLERRYRERAPAYFAPLMRRIHALSSEELATLLEEAELRGVLTESERQELLSTDVVVHGLWRLDGTESYLAVEVSGGIAAHDVERAASRAKLLGRITGKRAVPVVAGQAITDEGERAAKRLQAWRVLDGRCAEPSDPQSPSP